jgi:hypothetical protein
MRLDRQLIGHMFPNAGPSEEALGYLLFHAANFSLAKEIVMSLPSLCQANAGGMFTLYPAMVAVRSLGIEDREYVVTVLKKVALDVPVAGHLAEYIIETGLGNQLPVRACSPPHETVYGDLWGAGGRWTGLG